MKKKLSAFFCIAMSLLLLASCSSGYSSLNLEMGSGGYAPQAAPGDAYDYAEEYAVESDTADYEVRETSSGISLGAQTGVSLAEKIIYSANASIETVHFDDSLSELGNMIAQFGAFVESSYESGGDYVSKYYGYNAYRTANYVIRVPRESFSAMTGSLSALGHVTSLSTNADNVTEQYTDTESRLAVYRTEESRLLAMLEKSDTVADMITIESTLSSVRYEIESLTSRLKNLDNKVNYSSVTLSIREVEELTPAVQTHLTYGQQLSKGLKNTLKNTGNFFKNLLKFIVVNSPVIIILIIIIVVATILIRRRDKRPKRTDLHKATKDTKDK